MERGGRAADDRERTLGTVAYAPALRIEDAVGEHQQTAPRALADFALHETGTGTGREQQPRVAAAGHSAAAQGRVRRGSTCEYTARILGAASGAHAAAVDKGLAADLDAKARIGCIGSSLANGQVGDADGAIVPGGAVLSLTEPSRGGMAAGPAPPLVSVAAVLSPSGSLQVYAPKEEVAGLLELLDE